MNVCSSRNFFLLLGSFLEVLLLLVIVLCLTLSFHRSHLSLDCATLKTFPRPTTRSMLPGGPAGLRQPRLSPGATSGGCSASDHCYDQPAPPSLLAKVISGGINPKILRKSDTNTSPPPPSLATTSNFYICPLIHVCVSPVFTSPAII